MCKEWPGGTVSSVEAAAVRAAVAARSPREGFMGTTVPEGTMSTGGQGTGWWPQQQQGLRLTEPRRRSRAGRHPLLPSAEGTCGLGGECVLLPPGLAPCPALRAQDPPRRVPPASGTAALHTRLLWAWQRAKEKGKHSLENVRNGFREWQLSLCLPSSLRT